MRKNYLGWLFVLSLLTALTGCASEPLNSPCVDWGQWCSQTPINSWNNAN